MNFSRPLSRLIVSGFIARDMQSAAQYVELSKLESAPLFRQPARIPVGFVHDEGARHNRLILPDGYFLPIDIDPARQIHLKIGRRQDIAHIQQAQQVGLQRRADNRPGCEPSSVYKRRNLVVIQ